MTTTDMLLPLFEKFAAKKLPFCEKQTLYQYKLNIFKRYTVFLGHEPTVADMNDESIAACMMWMVKDKGLSEASANKMRDNFSCFWEWCARQKLVEIFPDIPTMTEQEKIPVAWTKEQLQLLWDCLSRQTGEYCGVPCNLWWVSLHAVLWDTASRLNAVRRAKWEDIDLDERWITLLPGNMKGKRRGQVLRLHPETVALLRRIQEPQREMVWPWPYAHSEYIYRTYKFILVGSGLPTGPDRAFHCMRKSSLSWFAAAGGDAQKLAGHSTPAMTERHYLDPKIVGGVNTGSKLFRMNDKPLSAPPVTVQAPAPMPARAAVEEFDPTDEFAFV